jgi:hypothetical protein
MNGLLKRRLAVDARKRGRQSVLNVFDCIQINYTEENMLHWETTKTVGTLPAIVCITRIMLLKYIAKISYTFLFLNTAAYAPP